MSKKAIFAQASEPYWIDVAAKLRDEYGWEICYFIGKKQQEKALKLFPRAVFHTKAEFRRNLLPDGCKAVIPSPLDKPLLSSLSEYESIFLKMMDRENYNGSLSYFERISVYHGWSSAARSWDVQVHRILKSCCVSLYVLLYSYLWHEDCSSDAFPWYSVDRMTIRPHIISRFQKALWTFE